MAKNEINPNIPAKTHPEKRKKYPRNVKCISVGCPVK